MSHPTPLEPLEPRVLLAANIPPGVPTAPGVTAIGRTIYIIGGAGNDAIRISRAPNDQNAKERPNQIQVQMDAAQPILNPSGMSRYYIDGGGGDDTIRIEADPATRFHGRVLIFGGDGNDTITGSRFADRIFGGAGDDYIYGFSGADQIHGGPGNDTLDGGYGRDRVFADDGNDTLIGGPGDDRLFGGPGDNTFRNNESAAERLGGSGRDILDGGGGNDTAENDPFDRRRLITG